MIRPDIVLHQGHQIIDIRKHTRVLNIGIIIIIF